MASNIAFTPALAPQIAIASPTRKLKLKGALARGSNSLDLVTDDNYGASRQEARELSKVVAYRCSISKKSIQRHQRTNCWKYRQKTIERNPRRDREHSVFRDAAIGANQNFFPAPLGRMVRRIPFR
jgi:hypothetical protein